ncbi:methyltransferase [Micractinium conductrix]|uniref:Methyltransferase n=1 Tax=Micractinium conductrix TaxID=554055 RepID=A0A2P6V1D5_9CHLO|nr:methyltransferase [Micractinium conductrix]|eukprot:PSC67895.1 methyltransferase [Micractinium conductrix]
MLSCASALPAALPAVAAALRSISPQIGSLAATLRRASTSDTPPGQARASSAVPRPSRDQWWSVREEERLESPQTRHGEDAIFESHHPSQRFVNVLSQYRNTYPNELWEQIEAKFPDRRRTHPVCVDIAIGAEGRGGVELARRGFHVVGVEADPMLLARTFRFAQAHGAHIELVTAKVEKSLLQNHTADLVTFLHGLHLVDTPAALDEAHRLLKPHGQLVAAWNDRNLDDPFIANLEDLFEMYNPTYNRHMKQRDVDQWKDTLEHGGRFKLQEYSVHPNPMRMQSAVTLLDVLDCMSFVRSRLRGSERKAFNNDVRALVEARYGRQPFELQLETKVYCLEKDSEGDVDPNRPVIKPVNQQSLFGV